MISERIIQPTDAITPGIYDIDNLAYHNGPGISRSMLMVFRQSPFHFWKRYIKNGGQQETKSSAAMELGSIVHTCVLEPSEFHKRYIVEPKVNKQSTAGKAKWAEHLANAGDRIVIDSETYEKAYLMSTAVLEDTECRGFLTGAQIEKTIYWYDPDTGILCKCRPDALYLNDTVNYVFDLKTAKNASARAFKYDMEEYGYHIQAGMISEACKHVINSDMQDFVYGVVESVEPYAVVNYPLNPRSLEKGRELFKASLRNYKECLESDKWPSYESQEISLPSYILNSRE
jgi:hypothetical protein